MRSRLKVFRVHRNISQTSLPQIGAKRKNVAVFD